MSFHVLNLRPLVRISRCGKLTQAEEVTPLKCFRSLLRQFVALPYPGSDRILTDTFGRVGLPRMAPLIESSRSPLKGAGLTKLRCLEQSGRVVFERDL